MPNMSYCRFENTAGDLDDCAQHINDELEGYEAEARTRMIRTMVMMLQELGASVDTAGIDPAIYEEWG